MEGQSNAGKEKPIESEIVAQKREDSFSDIIEKAGPLLKIWQEGEVKKVTATAAAEKEFIATEYRFKRILILTLGIGMLLILALCTFLFVANKDSAATNILTITLTGVISFIGGFGLGKSASGPSESA